MSYLTRIGIDLTVNGRRKVALAWAAAAAAATAATAAAAAAGGATASIPAAAADRATSAIAAEEKEESSRSEHSALQSIIDYWPVLALSPQQEDAPTLRDVSRELTYFFREMRKQRRNFHDKSYSTADAVSTKPKSDVTAILTTLFDCRCSNSRRWIFWILILL